MRSIVMYGIIMACLAACAGVHPDPEIPKVYENMDATQRIDIMPDGHGSAVVLTGDGFLLTNYHVAGKGDRVLLVNIAEGGKPAVAYPAQVVATDEKDDLAVIKVDHHFARTVVLADIGDAHPLDKVYGIGYPYAFGRLAAMGEIKAVGWSYADPGDPKTKIENVIALDMNNGPGTSGSGIFLARNGKLIGLMQLIVSVGERNDSGELVNDGRQVSIHAAIPIDVIRAFLDRANIQYRTTEPTWSDNPPP